LCASLFPAIVVSLQYTGSVSLQCCSISNYEELHAGQVWQWLLVLMPKRRSESVNIESVLLLQKIVHASNNWRIQRAGLGTLPPNFCFAPLNVLPLISVRPFLVPIKVETDIKKYS